MPSIALVGFGRIGRVHAEAAPLAGVDVLAVADPALPDGFRDAGTLLRSGVVPDAVVVATPTPTHRAVVDDIRRTWPGRIVVEKPVAPRRADAEHLLAGDTVTGVYHAAFGAEVAWASERIVRWSAAFGPLTNVTTTIADDYAADAGADERLGDSWVDGGINALSILARLVTLTERVELRRDDGRSSFAARFAFTSPGGEGEAAVATTWDDGAPASGKTTVLAFADGTTVHLDHAAMRAEVRAGDTLESFRAALAPPRLVQHYVAAYRALFGPSGRCFDAATERHLHRLLLAGVATEPADVASHDVRRLLAGLQAELNDRYGPQEDGGAAWWAELRAEDFSPPNGAFVVARLEGEVVGCGGLRRYDGRTGELKRMYTAGPARGHGVARAVLRHLERRAVDLGYRAVRLETGVWQPEAIALYEAGGYRPIANYGPYRDDPISRCFEKSLPPGRRATGRPAG